MPMKDGRSAWPTKTRSLRMLLLRSDLNRMSAKMAEEVVCMKSRHQGSAASTVSGSTGSGGSVGNFAARAAQNTFVASRIELKGWSCWRRHSMDETKQLIRMAKARLKQDDLNVFDWDLTDRDQGNLDTKMMAFMWFKERRSLPCFAKEFSSTFSNT